MEKSNSETVVIGFDGEVLGTAQSTSLPVNRLQEVHIKITLPDGNFSFGEALVPEAIIANGPEAVWAYLLPNGSR